MRHTAAGFTLALTTQCLTPSITEIGDGFIKAKAIDDRIGCAVAL